MSNFDKCNMSLPESFNNNVLCYFFNLVESFGIYGVSAYRNETSVVRRKQYYIYWKQKEAFEHNVACISEITARSRWESGFGFNGHDP